MEGTGVIDRFLEVFTRYIDSGFGLLQGEVAWLASTLIVIDVTLAALCDWRAVGVVTLFSASQSYAMMGWRVGFALAPAALVNAMQTLQGPITAAAPHLSQVAAVAGCAQEV